MKRLFCLSACTFALALFAGQASATIVSGTAQIVNHHSPNNSGFVKLFVPFNNPHPAHSTNTVGNNNFNTNKLYGFDEDQNILLATNLMVDQLADGSGGQSGAGSIAAGTMVASHYVFFDPKVRNPLIHQKGTVTFDADILGIITTRSKLDDSDVLANTSVTYLNPGLRGLESGDSADITGLRTMSVNWHAGSPGDYVRVLTAYSPGAVPAPPMIALFGLGLIGLGWMSRKRRYIRR